MKSFLRKGWWLTQRRGKEAAAEAIDEQPRACTQNREDARIDQRGGEEHHCSRLDSNQRPRLGRRLFAALLASAGAGRGPPGRGARIISAGSVPPGRDASSG